MTRDTVVLTVSLKIPDNEARSALEAVRVKMGFADQVVDLSRAEVWELEVEPTAVVAPDGAAAFDENSSTALAELERIVETTNLFANPNKHRFELAAGRATDLSLADDEIAILVSDRETARGDSMAAAVRRLGAGSVSGARRWVLWRIRLSKPLTLEEPGVVELIRRIGVADARDAGLLCNPHIQQAVAVLPWGAEESLVG